jgi:hypothetical protein
MERGTYRLVVERQIASGRCVMLGGAAATEFSLLLARSAPPLAAHVSGSLPGDP